MGKINWARVFLGGLLAGVILLAINFLVDGVFLRNNWQAAMRALDRTPRPNFLVVYVVWGFLAGISIVWLYAAARPRFGAGAKTAALTGFAFWIFGDALPNLGQLGFGLFPGRLLLWNTLAGLVQVIVASVVGAWVYKE